MSNETEDYQIVELKFSPDVKEYALWSVLWYLAHKAGQARLNGTAEEIDSAVKAHADYEAYCKRDDVLFTDSIQV